MYYVHNVKGCTTIIEGQHYKPTAYPSSNSNNCNNSYYSIHNTYRDTGCDNRQSNQAGASSRSTSSYRHIRHWNSTDQRRILPYQYHTSIKDQDFSGFCTSQPDIYWDSSVAFIGDSEHLLPVRPGQSTFNSCIQFFSHISIHAKSSADNLGNGHTPGNSLVHRNRPVKGDSLK